MPSPPQFVLVTGLSGAGKGRALRFLEDLGYYCVDARSGEDLGRLPVYLAIGRTRGRHRDIGRPQ